jgi:hypothetical protein
MNLFDWLNEITYSKRPWDYFTSEDKDEFNLFMIHRFISMNPDYIDVVNLIQQYPNCSKKYVYKYYCDMLPKKKSFFKYIKTSIKWEKETIDKIAGYYKCSTREAKEYISILTDNQIKDILNIGTSSTNKKRRKKS